MKNRQCILDVMTFVLVKVMGITLVARLFVVLRQTLMSMSWPSRFLEMVRGLKHLTLTNSSLRLKKLDRFFKQRWVRS